MIDGDEAHAAVDQLLLPRWADDLSESSPAREQTCYLEMEARMRRLSAVLRDATPLSREPERVDGLASTAGEMENVERITAVIAAHYTDPIGVADIAALVGLHPKYAMTLFKKNFGMSILEYMTRHRLSHAQRLLATTNDKVVDIAFDAGFGSASRFYEIFERECGQSPREFRRRMQFWGLDGLPIPRLDSWGVAPGSHCYAPLGLQIDLIENVLVNRSEALKGRNK